MSLRPKILPVTAVCDDKQRIEQRLFANLHEELQQMDIGADLDGDGQRGRRRDSTRQGQSERRADEVARRRQEDSWSAYYTYFQEQTARGTGAVTAELRRLAGRVAEQTGRAGVPTADELRAQLPEQVRGDYDDTVVAFQQMLGGGKAEVASKMKEYMDKAENAAISAPGPVTAEEKRKIEDVREALQKAYDNELDFPFANLVNSDALCLVELVAAAEDPVILVYLLQNSSKAAKKQKAEEMIATAPEGDQEGAREGTHYGAAERWLMQRVKTLFTPQADTPPSMTGLNTDNLCSLVDRIVLRTEGGNFPLWQILKRYKDGLQNASRPLNIRAAAKSVELPRGADEASSLDVTDGMPGMRMPGTDAGVPGAADIGLSVTNRWGRWEVSSAQSPDSRVADPTQVRYLSPVMRDKFVRFWEFNINMLLASSRAHPNSPLALLLDMNMNQVARRRDGDVAVPAGAARIHVWKMIAMEIQYDEYPGQELSRVWAETLQRNMFPANPARQFNGDDGSSPTAAIQAWHADITARQQTRRPWTINPSRTVTWGADLDDNRDFFIGYIRLILQAIDWRPNNRINPYAPLVDVEYSWFGTSPLAPLMLGAMLNSIAVEGPQDWAAPVADRRSQLRRLANQQLLVQLNAGALVNGRPAVGQPANAQNDARARRNNNDAIRARRAQVGNTGQWVSHLAKFVSWYEKLKPVKGLLGTFGPGKFLNDMSIRASMFGYVEFIVLGVMAYVEATISILTMSFVSLPAVLMGAEAGAVAAALTAVQWLAYVVILVMSAREMALGRRFRDTTLAWWLGGFKTAFFGATAFIKRGLGLGTVNADDEVDE